MNDVALVHFAVLVVCGTATVRGFRLGRTGLPRVIMFSLLGLIHGLVPMLTPRELMWDFMSDASVETSSWLTLLGVTCFAAGWRLAEPHQDEEGLHPALEDYIRSADGQRVLGIIFWAVAAVALVALLARLGATAGSLDAAVEARRFEYRNQGDVYFTVFMTHIVGISVVPGFIGFFLPNRYRIAGLAYSLAVGTLIFIVSHGARGPTLAIIGSVALGYALQARMRPARLLALAGVAVGVLALSVSLYSVRKVMSRATVEDVVVMTTSRSVYEDALTRDPLNYHQCFVAAVEYFPGTHPYLDGATYRRIAFFFLPRAWIPGLKPPDTHETFATVVMGENPNGTTIPPSMLGDAYINFWGAPGVAILMVINGWLFGWTSRQLRGSLLGLLVFGPGFARIALLGIRGSPYEISTTVLSSALLLGSIAALVTTTFGDRSGLLALLRLNQHKLTAPAGHQRVTPSTP